MENSALLIHSGDFKLFSMLGDAEAGAVVKALFAFFEDGSEPDGMDKASLMLFTVLRDKMVRDQEHYRKTSQARAENGRKGGLKTQAKIKQNQAKPKQNQAKPSTEKEKETESFLKETPPKSPVGGLENGGGDGEPSEQAKPSEPTRHSGREAGVRYPETAEEVRREAERQGIALTADEAALFLSHYQSFDWQTKNGVIRNWQARIRDWMSMRAPPGKGREGADDRFQRAMTERARSSGRGATEDFT